jgi:hypothetical protein
MIVAGAGYALLFALLAWQALRGQSILNPDATTVAALATWAAVTAATVWVATNRVRIWPVVVFQ